MAEAATEKPSAAQEEKASARAATTECWAVAVTWKAKVAAVAAATGTVVTATAAACADCRSQTDGARPAQSLLPENRSL